MRRLCQKLNKDVSCKICTDQDVNKQDSQKVEENLHNLKNQLTTKSHNVMRLLEHGKQREVIYSEKGGVWLRGGEKIYRHHLKAVWLHALARVTKNLFCFYSKTHDT